MKLRTQGEEGVLCQVSTLFVVVDDDEEEEEEEELGRCIDEEGRCMVVAILCIVYCE